MGGPWAEQKTKTNGPRRMSIGAGPSVNGLGRLRVREDEIGNLVRLETFLDGRLHQNVRGVPERDEIAERHRPEHPAEVVVVDEKLRRKWIDLHVINSKRGVPMRVTPLLIAAQSTAEDRAARAAVHLR
jgi:hypothetical protein